MIEGVRLAKTISDVAKSALHWEDWATGTVGRAGRYSDQRVRDVSAGTVALLLLSLMEYTADLFR